MNDSTYEKSIFDSLYSVITKIEDFIPQALSSIKNINPELTESHRKSNYSIFEAFLNELNIEITKQKKSVYLLKISHEKADLKYDLEKKEFQNIEILNQTIQAFKNEIHRQCIHTRIDQRIYNIITLLERELDILLPIPKQAINQKLALYLKQGNREEGKYAFGKKITKHVQMAFSYSPTYNWGMGSDDWNSHFPANYSYEEHEFITKDKKQAQAYAINELRQEKITFLKKQLLKHSLSKPITNLNKNSIADENPITKNQQHIGFWLPNFEKQFKDFTPADDFPSIVDFGSKK